MDKKSGWEVMSEKELSEVQKLAEEYMDFMSKNKTEREFVQASMEIAEQWGLSYRVFHGKTLGIFRPQGNPVEEGLRIIAAHVDAPRIDLKPQPVLEKENFVLFNTHYYGGIKKYQWLSIPLALHGVVIKKDGTKVEIRIGENEREPVLTIPDLLPHLSRKQMEKKATEIIEGENLDCIAGSKPAKVKENRFKKFILDLLKKNYGIEEEDLISSELQLVPAWNAREVGIDRSLIGAYGQDDRVCSFTALKAIAGMGGGNRTPVVILYDKEEIGSTGNTGATSRIIEDIVIEVLEELGIEPTYKNIRKTLNASVCLSADVNAGVNPLFPEVHDTTNAARLGYGLVLTKYTGHRGKGGTNDAHAELVYEIRRIFNENNVLWQTGELGKVDEGGGGTVARFIAEFGIDTIDSGIPLLAMHSPFEISSKIDVYQAYKGFRAFLES